MSDSHTQHPQTTVLAYLGVFCFVPLFLHKENSFVQWHAKQGIALFLLEVLAIWFAGTFTGSILGLLLLLACGLASIAGIVFVLKGEEKKLPLLGWMVEHLNI